jgi:hypothetical protein
VLVSSTEPRISVTILTFGMFEAWAGVHSARIIVSCLKNLRTEIDTAVILIVFVWV